MIRIITLYNSYNVGAFLQAFSLYSLLKKKNWDVSFLDVGQNPEEYFWRSIKYVRNPVDIIFQLRQRRKYRRAVKKHLPIVKKNQLGQRDTIIVGSDEMWNVNNGSFVHLQEYFGRNLVCRKKITYAVSGNGTGVDDLRQFDKTINFSEFDALSVRDNSTAMLVSSVAKRTAKKVCDPTVLFRNFQSEPVKKLGYDFLLVYTYPANLTNEERERIKEYAKRNGLKTVSVSLYNSWCDVNIAAEPLEFLGYLEQAKAVVTSTFHGTLLSIIYQKNVYTYAHNNEKICELLKDLKLSYRIVDGVYCYEDISVIDYVQVNARLDQMQSKADKWLSDNLNERKKL